MSNPIKPQSIPRLELLDRIGKISNNCGACVWICEDLPPSDLVDQFLHCSLLGKEQLRLENISSIASERNKRSHKSKWMQMATLSRWEKSHRFSLKGIFWKRTTRVWTLVDWIQFPNESERRLAIWPNGKDQDQVSLELQKKPLVITHSLPGATSNEVYPIDKAIDISRYSLRIKLLQVTVRVLRFI